MGETIAKMKVSGLTNGKSTEVEALVDTGATYSVIPEYILNNIGVDIEDTVTLELADGRTTQRDMGSVMIELEGKKRATSVLFGKENDPVLIGLVTLEACGLAVDTVNRKLFPLSKIHHY